MTASVLPALPPAAHRTRIVLGLLLALTLAAMDTTIVATAIPAIVRDLGGFSIFAWVFSAYVLAEAIAIPIYSKLADLYGRRPVIAVGVVVFLTGSMLCGISWNMGALIAFRALQGLGAGAIVPMVFTVIGDLYPLEQRGRIQGWVSTVWGITSVIGPAVGGFFSDYLSWRGIFYINLPVGALALFIVLSSLHEDVRPRKHQLDVAGSALLALGAGSLIFWLLQGGVQWPWLSPESVAILAVALIALAAFARQEGRAAEPTVPPWVVRSRVLMGGTAASCVVGMLAIGLTTYLPTYAQRVLALGATASGFLLTTTSLSWSVASVISNRLYLKIGFRNNALGGSMICVVAGLLFTLLPAEPPIWALVGCCAILGLGLGSIATPMIVGIQSTVDWQRRGVATGAYTFAQQLGQALGAALFSSIANSAIQAWLAGAPPDVEGQLPRTLSDASRALAGEGQALSAQAARYIEDGIAYAMHHVFIGLIFVALAGVLVLATTPRFVPISEVRPSTQDG